MLNGNFKDTYVWHTPKCNLEVKTRHYFINKKYYTTVPTPPTLDGGIGFS